MELERSTLQCIIQILKCHRNTCYASITGGDDIKPISATINVAVVKIADHYNPNCTVFELLEYVLTELAIYTDHQYFAAEYFVKMHGGRTVFSRPGGKWYIQNPANSEDDLADQWNSDSRIPEKLMWPNEISLVP